MGEDTWEGLCGVVYEFKRWADEIREMEERKGKGYGYRDLPACSKFEPLK
jgi:hypothetical protein